MAVDPLYVRGFNAESKRHHDNIRRAIVAAKLNLDALFADLDREPPSSLLAYNARQLAANATEAGVEIGAYLALHDVRFLTEPPEPPKEAE